MPARARRVAISWCPCQLKSHSMLEISMMSRPANIKLQTKLPRMKGGKNLPHLKKRYAAGLVVTYKLAARLRAVVDESPGGAAELGNDSRYF